MVLFFLAIGFVSEFEGLEIIKPCVKQNGQMPLLMVRTDGMIILGSDRFETNSNLSGFLIGIFKNEHRILEK